MFVFVLMMEIWEMLMVVRRRLMSVQMCMLTRWHRPVRVDMLMMLIMFMFMTMF